MFLVKQFFKTVRVLWCMHESTLSLLMYSLGAIIECTHNWLHIILLMIDWWYMTCNSGWGLIYKFNLHVDIFGDCNLQLIYH